MDLRKEIMAISNQLFGEKELRGNNQVVKWEEQMEQLAKDYALSCVPEEDPTIYGGIVQHTEKGKVELAHKIGKQKGWNECVKTIRENIRKETNE